MPGLKAALLEAPNQDDAYPQPYEPPSPQDVEIARRRVESSVCAFGGNHGESSGSAATKLVLDRNTADVSETLVVELAAPSDQLVLADQVTFLAGEDSITVDVGVLDNLVLEGAIVADVCAGCCCCVDSLLLQKIRQSRDVAHQTAEL